LFKTRCLRQRAFSLREMCERFRHPFMCVEAGPTNSVKIECVAKFIQPNNQTMTPLLQRIIWC